MNPERTIYVDMDDVLCETCRGLITLLRDEFGNAVAYEDVHDFDLGNSFSLTPDELDAFLDRAHHPDVLAGLSLIAGAKETLEDWSNRGFDIAILTGRPPSARRATVEWLGRNTIPHDHLYFVDKYGRFGDEAGVDGALGLDDLAALRFRLAIEDSPTTAAFLADNGVAPVVLLDRPWNRKEKRASITRVGGWEELAGMVHLLDGS
jgi:uncharacterized HAD superfamily protein